MKRKQYLFLVAVTIMAGLIGGAVSNRIFMAKTAVAQDPILPDPSLFSHFPHKLHKDAPKSIVAQEFLLVDENGFTRARLGKNPDLSSFGLYLYDADGKSCAYLIASDSQYGTMPMFYLWGNAGTPFDGRNTVINPGSISVSEGFLSNENGIALRASLGCSILSLRDRKGTSRITLMTDPGEVSIKLHDGDGQDRTVLGNMETKNTITDSIIKRAESSIVLFNKDNKVMWSAP